uniref:Tumor necrosis factor alpha-induced protein 8-like protein n=1 Tax=Trichogramma kaykai TaxID=54128 RepID=A0ABD2WWA0_9HYME
MSKFQEFLGSLRKEALVFPAVAAATATVALPAAAAVLHQRESNNNINDDDDDTEISTDKNHNNNNNNDIAVVAQKNPRKAIEIAWGSAVMELQSWLLYHLVAVDCNQVMQSAATAQSAYQMGPSSTIGPSSSMNGSSNGTSGSSSGSSRARDLGLRAQKKILGKFAGSNAGRALFIDDATAFMLDNLYKLMDKAARASPQLDKKQPEKVLKNIVKLSIKIGLLHKNQQLGPSDTANIEAVRRALHSCAMTVLSFYELEFSFDRAFLCRSFERCRRAVHDLVRPHLTDKSHERCDQVFDFLGHPDFLDRVFAQDSELRPILALLVQDLNKALENGQL